MCINALQMPRDIMKEHLLERLARPISSLYGVSKSSAYFWKASNGALVAFSSYAVHWTLILHYSHALFQLFLSNIPLFTAHSVTVSPLKSLWEVLRGTEWMLFPARVGS